MIRGCRYVIAVPDLQRSANYYRDTLGFEVLEMAEGWRFLRRDRCVIMAGECPDAALPSSIGDHSYFAYLEVDDVDDLYAATVARGAQVTKTLRTEPWRMREFGIRTIDGHRIMFGAEVPPAA
jgi:uncharacterized glyoxalase superfamily protein PhnB